MCRTKKYSICKGIGSETKRLVWGKAFAVAAVSEPEGAGRAGAGGRRRGRGASVLASQLVSFHALPSHPLTRFNKVIADMEAQVHRLRGAGQAESRQRKQQLLVELGLLREEKQRPRGTTRPR